MYVKRGEKRLVRRTYVGTYTWYGGPEPIHRYYRMAVVYIYI